MMAARCALPVRPTPNRHFCVIAVRKHPGVFISHCVVVGGWRAAACLVTALTDSGALLLGVVWGVFAGLLTWLAIRAAAWLESYFVATETRLIFITGLVTGSSSRNPPRLATPSRG
jgi:hypothetical protein